MKSVALLAVLVLNVYAGPFDCDENGKCSPGLTCMDGACVLRTDCPMLSMPRLKAGCKMEMIVDERDCPMPKIVCDKKNLKCGSIFCEPGYECDGKTLKCVPRTDCPSIALPEEEGCTDKMVLDEFDCLIPVRTCKPEKPLRQRRETTTTKTSVNCPKNAEWRECTNICPEKTCDNYLQKSTCFSLRCGPPGCMCKEGHVLLSHTNKETGCVTRETCVKLDSLKKNIERNKPTTSPSN
ncbi:hypothetical protein RB195_009102 [Necator americanus]|uniref:Uncharacterized protein n=2 Tax=Necator americanus TaxID=51031 RepID=A0ABR1CUC0_NECAM|nr:trypsin Inhibitor like cysteine rich domain protein [Necator americanus]ETN79721.1 trypsin Inhibitor like cysteine rich domain protein [Necator americanus]